MRKGFLGGVGLAVIIVSRINLCSKVYGKSSC